MRAGVPSGAALRSDVRNMSQEDHRMMEGFAQEQMPGGPAFQFDKMRTEINAINGPGPQAWANDFRAQDDFRAKSASPVVDGGHVWAGEFGSSARGATPMDQQQQQQHAGGTASAIYGGGIGYQPRFQGIYGGGFAGYGAQQQAGVVAQSASAPRIVELDDKKWEEQFKAIEEQSAKGKEAAREEVAIDDQVQGGEAIDEEDVQVTDDHFENVWERIKSQVLDNVDQFRDGDVWDRDFDEYTTTRPNFGDYQFEPNNPYMQDEDPYKIGCELMDHGAKLSLAALCFEAAVQKNPDHVEAWARLGQAQAQNEKEDPAIRALERCIKLDPTNLNALLNLSVSYTNEGYENAAYVTLERWLAVKYPELVDKARTQEPRLENEDRFELHSRVTELFIRAAQMSPDGANMDADVQVGLGVLFYGNDDFEKAIDCFNAALAVRPNDALLWNRLGATLANSNRSEEAIDAYYRALELRPSFVRARYNLGVSCINIGCYKEAAEHLLAALSLHKTDGPEDDVLANQSTNLYETLKRVFLAMERRDLVEKVGNGMNVNEFRGEFDF
jgi:peroxin-5